MRRHVPLALGSLGWRAMRAALPACPGCGRHGASAICPGCAAEADMGLMLHRRAGPAGGSVATLYYFGSYHDRRGGAGANAVARALARFKYGGDRAAGHALAWVFKRYAGWLPDRFDAVVPVPLHPRRLRARGFNQAAWFARAYARASGAKLSAATLHRRLDTRPQAELGAAARRRGVRRAFEGDPSRAHRRSLLLVDDVSTSGATILDAAHALRAAGAERVDALVLLVADRTTPVP